MAEKVATFHNICKDDADVVGAIIKALEGGEPEIVALEDSIIVTATIGDRGKCDCETMAADKITALQDALNRIGDNRTCRVELAYADPGTEVYVCWTHRKVWGIDTSEIGAQLDNPPKTCRDCVNLIKEVEEARYFREIDEEPEEPDIEYFE